MIEKNSLPCTTTIPVIYHSPSKELEKNTINSEELQTDFIPDYAFLTVDKVRTKARGFNHEVSFFFIRDKHNVYYEERRMNKMLLLLKLALLIPLILVLTIVLAVCILGVVSIITFGKMILWILVAAFVVRLVLRIIKK